MFIFRDRTKYFKHLLLMFVFSFIVYSHSFSQFEAQLSQYMFNHTTFNPASMGENGMIIVSGAQKMQWVGVPGAPVTTYFNINSPFKLNKETHAAGINFMRDQAGAFLNQSANVQYAYKKKMGDANISFGLGIGFIGMGIIADSLNYKNTNTLHSDYHVQNDNVVPKKDENGMGLDINAGVFFSSKKYYGGISYVHLNKPTFAVGDSIQFQMYGTLFLTGGTELQFDDNKYVLKPSALIKSDFASWQIDISSRLEFDKKYWGGLSYRFQDAIIIFGGINLSNGLSLGYSYDIPTSQIITSTFGSHEICLSYSFMLDTSKNNKKYKSIRIL